VSIEHFAAGVPSSRYAAAAQYEGDAILLMRWDSERRAFVGPIDGEGLLRGETGGVSLSQAIIGGQGAAVHYVPGTGLGGQGGNILCSRIDWIPGQPGNQTISLQTVRDAVFSPSPDGQGRLRAPTHRLVHAFSYVCARA